MTKIVYFLLFLLSCFLTLLQWLVAQNVMAPSTKAALDRLRAKRQNIRDKFQPSGQPAGNAAPN